MSVLTLADTTGTAEHNTPARALSQAMERVEGGGIARAFVVLVSEREPGNDIETMHLYRSGDTRLLCYDIHRAAAAELVGHGTGAVTWEDMDE